MMTWGPNQWFKYGFKTVVVLICFALFLANSWETLVTFKMGQTMESVSIIKPQDGKMNMPIIVICPLTAYINASKVMLSVEDFEENTINPEIYLDQLDWMVLANQTVQWGTQVLQIQILLVKTAFFICIGQNLNNLKTENGSRY